MENIPDFNMKIFTNIQKKTKKNLMISFTTFENISIGLLFGSMQFGGFNFIQTASILLTVFFVSGLGLKRINNHYSS